ncbi:MAG: type VI secretion system tip protein VgrG [Myxococcales bacterium]|nr:type VI secretion system tip protein VgrG [Myxococcales bacterium]
MSERARWELEIEGVDATLRVTRMRGREGIHAPYRFEVWAMPLAADGTPTAVAADAAHLRPATLTFIHPDDSTRAVQGLVDEVVVSGRGLAFVIVPHVALLDHCVDHRVFVDLDPITIAAEVLGEHDLALDQRVARTPDKRSQCVQDFESDLGFVSRILAEEGINWYLPAAEQKRLVITDQPSGYDDLPGGPELPLNPGGGLTPDESVFGVKLRREVAVEKVSLQSYDPDKPELDLGVGAETGAAALEAYEYPGRYRDGSLGATLARLRLDQLRGHAEVLSGVTNCSRLVAGHVLALGGGERTDLERRWLVVEVSHEVAEPFQGEGDDTPYAARFVAVPADIGFRVDRPTAPRVDGVQTATVVGPSGAEIHTESGGRVKLLHRWDRLHPPDDTASAFARVVQPPSSGGFLLPRTGWEALVAFHATSLDQPFAVGRVYNGTAPPPNALPGDKVVSAFGTRTTPGGGSQNLLALDDTAGDENMTLVASKDLNERTENDKNTGITVDDGWSVGANRTLIVGQVLSVKVGGAQSYHIGANRTLNTTSNKLVNAASESVTIGGVRSFDVGGDYKTSCATLTRLVGGARVEAAIEKSDRAVQGAHTVLVGGSWRTVAGLGADVVVMGANTELVAGTKKIDAAKYTLDVRGAYKETLASRKVKAGGDREEGFGAAASYQVGASATLAGADVSVKATSKITIKAGGVTVTITPSAVKIKGDVKSSVKSNDAGDQKYG